MDGQLQTEVEFNNKTMTKLEHPKETTYFIGWNDKRTEIVANGAIETTQVMETKLTEVDFYTDIEAYNKILIDNNIEL